MGCVDGKSVEVEDSVGRLDTDGAVAGVADGKSEEVEGGIGRLD